MSTPQTSTIILYALNYAQTMSDGTTVYTSLSSDKNFVVEDIETMLSGVASANTLTFTNTFFKHELYKNVKLSLPGEYSVLAAKINYTYAKVTTSDLSADHYYSKPIYYFVKAFKWLSSSVCDVTLEMDVLNTFPPTETSPAKPYTLGNRTHILREHDYYKKWNPLSQKLVFTLSATSSPYTVAVAENGATFGLDFTNDTFYNKAFTITTKHISGATPNVTGLWQKQSGIVEFHVTASATAAFEIECTCTFYFGGLFIDRFSEGIFPELIKYDDKEIRQDVDVDWLMIYKNKPNPNEDLVDCFALPSEPQKFVNHSGTATYAWLPSDFTTYAAPDYYWYGYMFYDGNVPAGLYDYKLHVVDADGNNILFTPLVGNVFKGITKYLIKSNGTYFEISAALDYEGLVTNIKTITKTGIYLYCEEPQALHLARNDSSYANTDRRRFLSMTPESLTTTLTAKTAQTSFTSKDFKTVSRADPDLIRIIAAPYAPYAYSINESDEIDFASTDITITGAGALLDVAGNYYTKMNYVFDGKVKDYYDDFIKSYINEQYKHARSFVDPKLFHSDYTKAKAYFDSFNIVLPFERRRRCYGGQESNLKVGFAMTGSITSKFLFYFPDNQNESVYDVGEDYPALVCVGRNNDVTIFNSAYIDYIKTGYNYDVKAKTRSDVSSVFNVAQGTASIATGIVSLVMENPAGAGMIASGAGQVINSIERISASKDSIARNLDTALMQAVNVNGSDDLDLFRIYGNNRLRYALYQPREEIKTLLDDLFYFFGYKRDAYAAPKFNKRFYFDYVQFDPEFQNVSYGISGEILNKLRERFQSGVTVFHKVTTTFPDATTTTTAHWDLAQIYDNPDAHTLYWRSPGIYDDIV